MKYTITYYTGLECAQVKLTLTKLSIEMLEKYPAYRVEVEGVTIATKGVM